MPQLVQSRRHRAATVGMSIMAALGIAAIIAQVGLSGSVLILASAAVPAVVCASIVLLFDRYEPEPRRLLWLTFAFGATVAVPISLFLEIPGEGIAVSVVGASAGNHVGTIVIAPIVEELAKGLAVFGIYYWVREEFNGIIDGIVYASMVALGFAFAENTGYYANALSSGFGQFTALAFVRGGLSAFAHPLFTSMTGIGLAMASRGGRGRFAWVIGGLAGATLLHAIWNGSAAGGGWFQAYVVVFLPALAVVLLFARAASKSEAKIIRSFLAKDVALGLLTPAEVEEVSSLKARRATVLQAAAWGGPSAKAARIGFHNAVANLAFHRHRVYPTPPDPFVEYPLVCEIARYKLSLNPGWTVPPGLERCFSTGWA